jgi:Protein of unknown function (DUF4242)
MTRVPSGIDAALATERERAAREGGRPMAKFMDVHNGFIGVTASQLEEAHGRDLAIEADEGVHFERAWLDPELGKVFCLATGPSKEAVMRIHERAGHPTGEVYELAVEV